MPLSGLDLPNYFVIDSFDPTVNFMNFFTVGCPSNNIITALSKLSIMHHIQMTREVRDSKNTLMRPKQVQAFKSRDSPSLRPGTQTRKSLEITQANIKIIF